ncbi:thioredoxin family protein [Haloferula sp. BvORR071]|uniref:thioredoxin family protein n=1 Tax=Haloferula sp. BvORR071 TaxID=1396141 RepID=UPI0005575486|nr:thioredoxin family protein [Haloferula sp. BvORR071]
MKTFFRPLAVLVASASMAMAASEGWVTDWEAAKAKAKAEKKPILINLTGSDWCGWCIKLHQEVFDQKAFKDYAAANLILMEADFPKKTKLPEALAKQNKTLEKEYLNGGYPTVLLLDAEGKKLSKDLGYQKGGPEAYIATIKEELAKKPAAEPAKVPST